MFTKATVEIRYPIIVSNFVLEKDLLDL